MFIIHYRYAKSHPGFVRGHKCRWMQVWITLHLMMAISPKPNQAQHWSKDDLHKAPFFHKHMPQVLSNGYNLYVDNWYSSPTLFHWLQAPKTNACGTVQANRKIMPCNFPDKLKMNEMERRSTSTGMICLKRMDKKAIYVLSTLHTSKIDRVNRSGNNVMKPKAIIDYPAVRRSLKYYKKVFMYLFDMVMVNTFLLFKHRGGERPFA